MHPIKILSFIALIAFFAIGQTDALLKCYNCEDCSVDDDPEVKSCGEKEPYCYEVEVSETTSERGCTDRNICEDHVGHPMVCRLCTYPDRCNSAVKFSATIISICTFAIIKLF